MIHLEAYYVEGIFYLYVDFEITEEIKQLAWRWAQGRDHWVKVYDRRSYYDPKHLPSPIRNWIGAIGEVCDKQVYPILARASEDVSAAADIHSTDWKASGKGWETKTSRRLRTMPRPGDKNEYFYVSEAQVKDRKGIDDFYILNFIDDNPENAKTCRILGYVTYEEVTALRPVTPFDPQKPGYEIPLSLVKPCPWPPQGWNCPRCGGPLTSLTGPDGKTGFWCPEYRCAYILDLG